MLYNTYMLYNIWGTQILALITITKMQLSWKKEQDPFSGLIGLKLVEL